MQTTKSNFTRNIIIAFSILFAPGSLSATSQVVADKDLLVVEMISGDMQTIELSRKPEVTFDGKGLKVSSADGSFLKEYSNVKQFYFQAKNEEIKPSNNSNNGISDVFAIDASHLKELTPTTVAQPSAIHILSFKFIDGENVVISGAGEQSAVKIYSATGVQVGADVRRNADELNISLTGLQSGIYIINVGTETFKVRVK